MSDTVKSDLQMEQERVNFVSMEIDKKKVKLQKNTGGVSSDVLELRKTFWEDVTVNMDEPDDVIETAASIKQQAELLSERERTFKQMDKQIRILERLKYSPYFGRIDFLEADEKNVDQVYLGIASLMDEHDENFLIYDWRAPISSLYYDFAPGPASYPTMDGEIKGEMKLKRQFIIRASDIKAMFDTGVTIGDEMLQEVLGNNANAQMKSIVATIQREQNLIIRNERSKLLIVQGVAGSGKTSAALQRVAYLLYRYRETIKSENIMLFSPNPLFNSYVSTVLPELGEENMEQATFMEYLNNRIGSEFDVEDPFDQMEFLLNNGEHPDYDTRVRGIRYKASLPFKEMIDRYVIQLSSKGLLFKDLVFRGEIIISNQLIYDYFYSLDASFTIPNRMEMVKDWLLRELKRKVKQERSKSWVEDEVQYLEKEDYLEAYQELQGKDRYTEKSFDDFEQEQKILAEKVVKQKFRPLFSRVKKLNFLDMKGLYSQLFIKGAENLEVLLDDWTQICTQTVETLANYKISYEDATPFVYLQDLIKGRKSSTGIRHIFIDEAQDYSPFQFALIQRLFPYSKMTLLGDFNQAIYSGATGSATVISDYEEKGEDIEKIVLTKTYRSTKEIVDFTSSLVEGGEKIEPFNRHGKKPSVKLAEQNQLNGLILGKINEFLNEGHRTIAVICRTAAESKRVYTALKDVIPVHLIEKATIAYEKGILVISSYLAKGIEFDGVILYDSSQYKNESERKLFYTVCTRAMHRLHMYATKEISPLMNEVPGNLYELE
ncbi:DNA helicase-2/ATP-dependent DNA helicase PcrA [Bacillus niacini]|uniref:DNA helicase-2/ATP-dependent DNA helicase PcrA n=1 Tax=Neobacillus niacini TaxID=86668 RepID=A0A852TQA8_9BACI|nr:RNA polymerase recycling motor HelD [Neobacillus niacini]NYE09238.1 DNA helicase-2/ATP-dependent DNA helicase PcrA [Neobacillus niacini]